MENGKRAKGKSKQISAKKKIIWSVDLVEVQKDEEGRPLSRLISNGLCRAANQRTMLLPRNSSSFQQNLPRRRRPHIKLL